MRPVAASINSAPAREIGADALEPDVREEQSFFRHASNLTPPVELEPVGPWSARKGQERNLGLGPTLNMSGWDKKSSQMLNTSESSAEPVGLEPTHPLGRQFSRLVQYQLCDGSMLSRVGR